MASEASGQGFGPTQATVTSSRCTAKAGSARSPRRVNEARVRASYARRSRPPK